MVKYEPDVTNWQYFNIYVLCCWFWIQLYPVVQASCCGQHTQNLESLICRGDAGQVEASFTWCSHGFDAHMQQQRWTYSKAALDAAAGTKTILVSADTAAGLMQVLCCCCTVLLCSECCSVAHKNQVWQDVLGPEAVPTPCICCPFSRSSSGQATRKPE